MLKFATAPFADNNQINAKRSFNSNEFYANKNKVDLFDFLNKTGKSMPEVDSKGNMIVDRNDTNRSRWLEE